MTNVMFDAETRDYARRERSRLVMARFGIVPSDGVGGHRGHVRSSPLSDSHEARVAEVEAAIAAYEQSLDRSGAS